MARAGDLWKAVMEGNAGKLRAALRSRDLDFSRPREAFERSRALAQAARMGVMELLRVFIEEKADLGDARASGNPPLLEALAARGAAPAALHWTARMGRGLACVEPLIQAGADESARTRQGLGLLDFLSRSGGALSPERERLRDWALLRERSRSEREELELAAAAGRSGKGLAL